MRKLLTSLLLLFALSALVVPQSLVNSGGRVSGQGVVRRGAAAGGGSGWVAIASTAGSATVGHAIVTTSAIDTTGADLIVTVSANYSFLPEAGDQTDSKSNTWTMLTPRGASDAYCTIYYTRPTSVGSGHTFTWQHGSSDTYPALAVFALSGSVASPFDQQNGASATATSLATGSITPTQNNELIITGLALSGAAGSVPAIDSGMTIRNSVAFGDDYGVSLAWTTQTTAAAINPTWSWTNSLFMSAAIASFKAP